MYILPRSGENLSLADYNAFWSDSVLHVSLTSDPNYM